VEVATGKERATSPGIKIGSFPWPSAQRKTLAVGVGPDDQAVGVASGKNTATLTGHTDQRHSVRSVRMARSGVGGDNTDQAGICPQQAGKTSNRALHGRRGPVYSGIDVASEETTSMRLVKVGGRDDQGCGDQVDRQIKGR